MGQSPLSDDLAREAVEAVRLHGSQGKAAEVLKIGRSTLQNRISHARQRGLMDDGKVEFPTFVTDGDDELTDEEIIARFRKSHERKQKAIEARTWFPIKVNEDKPYGFLVFGDPHLGSGNFPLLERHLEIARQDGVYGGNIGDTTDNWPWTGKLARMWAEADYSNKTEKQAAEWLMFRAGVRWLVWLLGNHDEWNGGTEFYKRLGAFQVPVIDWRAQFTLVHKNGSQTRIDAAHGRKGTSIYNPTHGTLRDAKFGEHADLYVTGHIHSYGLFDIEFPEKKTRTWLAQISGYKFADHWALTKGFAPANHGAAVLAVIDPATGKVQCFGDPIEGAEFLKWKRR